MSAKTILSSGIEQFGFGPAKRTTNALIWLVGFGSIVQRFLNEPKTSQKDTTSSGGSIASMETETAKFQLVTIHLADTDQYETMVNFMHEVADYAHLTCDDDLTEMVDTTRAELLKTFTENG